MTQSFAGGRVEAMWKRLLARMLLPIPIDELLQAMLQERNLTAPIEEADSMHITAHVSWTEQNAGEFPRCFVFVSLVALPGAKMLSS